ncbi:MAG: energy transducer TonB [Bacteroidetes bacterium]|nr:energy transducer TonB [Bacteroidota bacterium]
MEPDLVLQVADQMPEFPGGQSNINAFLMKHIQYPTQAREMGIQGKVICRFVVNSDGLITNLTTINSIGGGCEQEALRVLKMMPKWKPGKHQGKAVKVQMQLPILFKLK